MNRGVTTSSQGPRTTAPSSGHPGRTPRPAASWNSLEGWLTVPAVTPGRRRTGQHHTGPWAFPRPFEHTRTHTPASPGRPLALVPARERVTSGASSPAAKAQPQQEGGRASVFHTRTHRNKLLPGGPWVGVLGESAWSLWMDLGRCFFGFAACGRGLSTASMSCMSFSCLRRRCSCRMNSLRARSSSFLCRSSSVFRLRSREVRSGSAPHRKQTLDARAHGRGGAYCISAPWGKRLNTLEII